MPTPEERIKRAIAPKPVLPLDKTDIKRIQRTWIAVWLFGILVALMIGAQIFLFAMIQGLSADIESAKTQARQDTLANRETGYKNRGINCQVLVALSQPLPASCLEPEVTKHYNPAGTASAGANSSSQVKIRGMLCRLLRDKGEEPERCTDPNAPLPPGF